MQAVDAETLVKEYLQVFADKDLARCMEHFAEDALLVFGPKVFGLGQFRGTEEIEQWHKDRFTGGMKITHIDEIMTEGDTVTVRAVATSPVLKAIHLDDFRGEASFLIRDGKFAEVRLGLRRGYRFHI